MELRKEYSNIVNTYGHGLSTLARSQIELTALACQELVDRPPRELTDAEIHKVVALHGYVAADGSMLHKMLKAIEAAAHAKQREPQVVKFRAARSKVNGKPMVFEADAHLELTIWEWLEPAQEIEVRT